MLDVSGRLAKNVAIRTLDTFRASRSAAARLEAGLVHYKGVAVDVIRRDDCPPFVTKDTSEIREILAYRNSSCKTMSLAEATLYPGKHTENHYHPKTEEIYYILSGVGRICVDGEERAINPGDAVMLPPGCSHQTWNTGSAPLVFLCCCSPAYEHEDTVLQ